MATEDLSRADPIPRVISWLNGHASVTAALGGTGRIGLDNEPPYPRLRITDPPGGSDRSLRKLISQVVQVEAYGDLDGVLGKGELKRICYIALAALAEIPDAPVPAGSAVISHVESLLGGGWQPEPTGQPRYVAQVLVWSHPGQA